MLTLRAPYALDVNAARADAMTPCALARVANAAAEPGVLLATAPRARAPDEDKTFVIVDGAPTCDVRAVIDDSCASADDPPGALAHALLMTSAHRRRNMPTRCERARVN